jgi:hypothetical protein
MDTVLFTDQDILAFVTVATATILVLVVLLISTRVEQRVGRLESKIRQIMWPDRIHQ